MTNIKICGLTNLEDASVAAESGVDFLGFIFHPSSPRYVTPETVRAITTELRATLTQPPACVGVFVDVPSEQINVIMKGAQLDAAQLHGGESPQMVRQFAGRAYKALRPKSNEEGAQLVEQYTTDLRQSPTLPDVLLDAYHPTLYGGTGHKADWDFAADIAQQHRLMLAGSLTPDNVAQAVRTVRPWAVDVSSGVEAVKGRKAHQQLRRFVEAVREASAEVIL